MLHRSGIRLYTCTEELSRVSQLMPVRVAGPPLSCVWRCGSSWPGNYVLLLVFPACRYNYQLLRSLQDRSTLLFLLNWLWVPSQAELSLLADASLTPTVIRTDTPGPPAGDRHEIGEFHVLDHMGM